MFNDKTSLILHPKGDCFTYFRKDGRKLRQLVKYALNHSGEAVSSTGEVAGPMEKLCLAI